MCGNLEGDRQISLDTILGAGGALDAAEFPTTEFEVVKWHHSMRWLRQNRVLRLTPEAIENVDPSSGEATKRHPYSSVTNVRLVDASYLVIAYSEDHDYHYKTADAVRVTWEINRRIKARATRDRFRRCLHNRRRTDSGCAKVRALRDAFSSSGVPLPPALSSGSASSARQRQQEGAAELQLTELLMDKRNDVGRAVFAAQARVDKLLRDGAEAGQPGSAVLRQVRDELLDLRERVHAALLARAASPDRDPGPESAARSGVVSPSSEPGCISRVGSCPSPLAEPREGHADPSALEMLDVQSPATLAAAQGAGATEASAATGVDVSVFELAVTAPAAPAPAPHARAGLGGGAQQSSAMALSFDDRCRSSSHFSGTSALSAATDSPAHRVRHGRADKRRRGMFSRRLDLRAWRDGGDGTAEELLQVLETALQHVILRPRAERLFAALRDDPELCERSRKLQSVLEQIRDRPPSFFHVAEQFQGAELGPAVAELAQLAAARAPCDKLEALVLAAKQMCIACAMQHAPHAAPTDLTLDDLLPLLMCCIARAEVSDHAFQAEFLWCLSDDSSADEHAFYFTVYKSAIEYLATIDPATGDARHSPRSAPETEPPHGRLGAPELLELRDSSVDGVNGVYHLSPAVHEGRAVWSKESAEDGDEAPRVIFWLPREGACGVWAVGPRPGGGVLDAATDAAEVASPAGSAAPWAAGAVVRTLDPPTRSVSMALAGMLTGEGSEGGDDELQATVPREVGAGLGDS
eukprot:TRINITY_DN542_c0_g4_i1.p1 TRINITY_DN542_c0_g4~~TRINITY_DN542_c0_g4_i1.p1  ORF type:complete len:788 (+),score=249.17 TRINITY_DN542_c0_g4_i1:108-2366(+)